MTPARLDLVLVIEAGSFRRPVLLADVACALGLPTRDLRSTLLGLLRVAFPSAPSLALSGEPTEGVRSEAIVRSERKEIFNPERSSVRTGTTRPLEQPRLPVHDGCVPMLIELLGDPNGERALRALVAKHPRTIIEQALQRTLAVPESRITRSRAAYFTALVRALDSHSQPQRPYDTHSSSAKT